MHALMMMADAMSESLTFFAPMKKGAGGGAGGSTDEFVKFDIPRGYMAQEKKSPAAGARVFARLRSGDLSEYLGARGLPE